MTKSYHWGIICLKNHSGVIIIGMNLSPDERIKAQNFLDTIKPLLKTNECQFKISEKNKSFDREFNMRDKEKKDIINSLTVDDCISIENNNNPRYADSEIYKFLKNITFPIYGENGDIEIYIKMYLQECDYYNMVIVISFHKSGEYE